ncbi:putative phage abortive infection protein [Pasteurella multocida]|uniref:putative phage abortive infection protein n=1 Tax=Pasteurella multocida TaxID=747 RepID=UPI003CF542EF
MNTEEIKESRCDRLTCFITILIYLLFGTWIGLCIFFYIYVESGSTTDGYKLNTKFEIEHLIDVSGVIATFMSSVGLIIIGYLTYKNQKSNAFQVEFDNLLKEHHRTIKETFYQDGNFNFHTQYLLHKISRQNHIENGNNTVVNLKTVSETFIYGREEVSRYFILLYRILDRIDKEVPKNDKKRYSGLLRVCIPHEILLLVAVNALNENFGRYKFLLEKFEFLEHLPVSLRFFKTIRLNSAIYLNNKKTELGEKSLCSFELSYIDSEFKKDISRLQAGNLNRIKIFYETYLDDFLNNLFEEKIWGGNIYRIKYLEAKKAKS